MPNTGHLNRHVVLLLGLGSLAAAVELGCSSKSSSAGGGSGGASAAGSGGAAAGSGGAIGTGGGNAATGGAVGSGGRAAASGGAGGTAGNPGGTAGNPGGTAGASGSPGAAVGVACADAAPYVTTGTPAARLTVNAATPGAAWNRFYERGVAADHANTILSTVYGRNIQAALKKGHDQAGFQYARFHGILDSDIGLVLGVQGGTATTAGTLTYDWTKFDQVYDALVSIGMRAVFEVSFMPPALSSGATMLQYYGGMPANINPPASWPTWQKLMADIVTHLETRYGAAEIRNNWYFEVWNEPSWQYSLNDTGYAQLYTNTVTGLLAGDPQIKVGGPAELSGVAVAQSTALVNLAKTATPPLKLDFVSYHRYGNDNGGQVGDANGNLAFHQSMVAALRTANFTGELLNDEFGSSWTFGPARDNESNASFVAKTVHLIGASATPPTMYAYWAISDLYEEINTDDASATVAAGARAYREGNFGMLLKGDATIPVSFDVAKPVFNAFRLLHRMGATQIPLTGGTTGDGVNGVATVSADGNTLQILVYNHATFTGGAAETMSDPTQPTLVSLTVNGVPFAPGSLKVRHYLVDHTHSNSYTTWVGLGKPAKPTAAQWSTLAASAEVCYYDTTVSATGNSWTVMFPQLMYSVALIEITH